MAILMYAIGNMRFRSIGQRLGVSDVTVMYWVRAEAEALPEPDSGRTIAGVLGRRDDATCHRRLDKAGMTGRIFVTDDWEGYRRGIPENRLFTGKNRTVGIKRDNSSIRHFLAYFRRKKSRLKIYDTLSISICVFIIVSITKHKMYSRSYKK